MHGRIDVESEKGKGTRFTVTVTLAESSHTLSGGGFDPAQVKALVVDEDKDACQGAVLALSESGIETEGASSAAEAMEEARLRHARQEPYTLVLAACTSSLDGPALARGLRAGAGCGSAVVFLAAASWDEAGKEAAGPGIDGFLAKPLLAGPVLEELRKVLARKRPAGSGELDFEVLKGRRVLLAEDNELNAEIMQMLLQMRGMSVDIAANGQICVEKFKARPAWHYDAILMDMRMPEMDGIQATAAIRRLEREDAGRIPVIALTANAFNEDVVHSLQSGLDAHLSKPVEPELLYRTLTSFLSR